MYRTTAHLSLTVVLASTPSAVWGRQENVVPIPIPVEALARSAVEEADSLFDALDARAALDRLRIRLEVAPDDFEARWRAARAALAFAVMTSRGAERANLLREGEAHADHALAVRPDHIESLNWSAALKGRRALEGGGPREKSRLGQEAWELAHRVLTIDPNDAFAHDILGKLSQEVSKLGGFKRFLARTFLGSDLLRLGTWEGAERHLRAAIDSDPRVVLFFLDLGDTYLRQDKLELARGAFEAGLELPDRFPPDARFKRTIRRRLAAMTN